MHAKWRVRYFLLGIANIGMCAQVTVELLSARFRDKGAYFCF
jgi:hypothetical protein